MAMYCLGSKRFDCAQWAICFREVLLLALHIYAWVVAGHHSAWKNLLAMLMTCALIVTWTERARSA